MQGHSAPFSLDIAKQNRAAGKGGLDDASNAIANEGNLQAIVKRLDIRHVPALRVLIKSTMVICEIVREQAASLDVAAARID